MEQLGAFANVARTATALAEAGLKPEALYTLSETINVSQTEEDLANLREHVVPAIRKIEAEPVLQKLPGINAVRIRPRSHLLSDRAKLIYGLKDEQNLDEIVLFVEVPKASPYEICRLGKDDLLKGGDAFAVLLDVAVAGAGGVAGLPFDELLELIRNLKPRELPVLTSDTMGDVTKMARDFALGGATQATRTTAFLTGVLARQAKTEASHAGVAKIWKSLSQRVKEITTKASAETVAEKLYHLGYGPQGSDLYIVSKPQGQLWLPPWMKAEDDPVLASIEQLAAVAPDQGRLRRTVPFEEIVRTIANDLKGERSNPYEVELEEVLRYGKAARGTPKGEYPPRRAGTGARGKAIEARPRSINVWLEKSDTLVAGSKCDVSVNVGAPREGTTASRQFTEPDWGGRQSLDITFILTSEDADVTPQVQSAVLTQAGDSEPVVVFHVTAQKIGPIGFSLTVVTSHAWAVLQRVSFSIDAVKNSTRAIA